MDSDVKDGASEADVASSPGDDHAG
jgi:hypothetical protein